MRFHPLLAILAVAACGTDDSPGRRDFIQKANHALHPSAPPLTDAQVDALLDKSDEDIVAQLYTDQATRDAVFKMSLAFLGAPIDELHAAGHWAPPPFMYAPAVAAARSFRNGADPLDALLTSNATSATGVAEPVRPDLLQAFFGLPPPQGTTAQRRTTAANAILGNLASLRRYVAGLTPFDENTMCETYLMSVPSVIGFEITEIMGVPESLIAGGYPQELDDIDGDALDYACLYGQTTTQAEALAHIDHTKQLYQQLFARLEPVFAAWESNPESAFDPADYASIGFSSYADAAYYGRTHFYPQFWMDAQNSSTNFDRRRGAYVLDRFFCDDLKPVGAALPAAHADGKHASDPSCQACHFKLDPMAGFFRRHGYQGIEFSDATLAQSGGQIIFDDLAQIPFSQYDAAWRAPAGSGRTYDIGYIRSTRDTSLNSYGDTLGDLDTLLKTAPEVERCFTQRMFEYFNGTDQAVDPGFLDDVATDMHGAGANRLQRGIVRILTGETFRTPDRNSTVCYDLAPGADPAGRPPCEVASILKANCTSCHGGANPQAGLDLSRWEKASDGSFGFHEVVDGASVAHLDTFTRMKERVMTSDLTRQMPQDKDMPLHQREALALWLQTMIDASSK